MDDNRDAKGLGHGKGYAYPHSFPEHHTGQQYLPTNLLGRVFYKPSTQGYEAEVAERVERWRKAQAAALGYDYPANPPGNKKDAADDTAAADSPRGK